MLCSTVLKSMTESSFFVPSVFGKTNQSTAKRQTEKTRDASVAGPAEAAEPGGTVRETGKKNAALPRLPLSRRHLVLEGTWKISHFLETLKEAFVRGYLEDFTCSGDP